MSGSTLVLIVALSWASGAVFTLAVLLAWIFPVEETQEMPVADRDWPESDLRTRAAGEPPTGFPSLPLVNTAPQRRNAFTSALRRLFFESRGPNGKQVAP